MTLDDATNEFRGTVTVAAGATTLKDADNLVAGNLTTTGTTDRLTLITDRTVGTLGVSGSATGDLTTNAAATTFGATTVGGNLAITGGGAVTDTGKLDITGTTGITATGQTVTLDDATNEFGGTVTVATARRRNHNSLKDADNLVAALTTTGTTELTAVGTFRECQEVPTATSYHQCSGHNLQSTQRRRKPWNYCRSSDRGCN